MKKKVIFNLKVPVSIFKEAKTYIAYSPVLDLSTSASNFEKAQKRFSEAVSIFIEELVEMGTIDEVLSDLGWQKIDSQWQSPLPVMHSMANVAVAIN
jgi:hypothetical protein